MDVEVGATNFDNKVRQVESNRIREGQVEQPMVEGNTPLGNAGEASQVVVEHQHRG